MVTSQAQLVTSQAQLVTSQGHHLRGVTSEEEAHEGVLLVPPYAHTPRQYRTSRSLRVGRCAASVPGMAYGTRRPIQGHKDPGTSSTELRFGISLDSSDAISRT
eukprot:1870646-Rhodomonas_salina.2